MIGREREREEKDENCWEKGTNFIDKIKGKFEGDTYRFHVILLYEIETKVTPTEHQQSRSTKVSLCVASVSVAHGLDEVAAISPGGGPRQ